jgi:hypothetical protein
VPRDAALSAEHAEAARSAPFVFFGTVRQPGGSNVEALDREEEPSAVVHVDELVVVPNTLGDITGQEVTVRLTGPRPRRGQRLLFMASSLVYGNELGVIEVARVAPGRQAARMREEILEEKLRQHDDELLTRLRRAEVVVYGRVESIESFLPESAVAAPQPLGEAAPSWRIADLLVWRVLKGQPQAGPRVVFPFPRTQRWPEVPLFVEGQEGIWLLHSLADRDPEVKAGQPPTVANGFEAPDELDFHAPGSLPRIQLLLQILQPQGRRR